MQPTTKPLLLVAEDDPDDQLLIQEVLEAACDQRVEMQFVSDGVELMNYLRSGGPGTAPPELLVLDLNMPRKDGLTALREIKSDPRLARIPVAVLTTSGSERDVQLCVQQGVVGYFRKPSSVARLREILSSLCDRYLFRPEV